MTVAIVTGANSGIGRAAAVALARSGFDLGITWHREESRAQSAVQEIAQAGARCELRHLDLHAVTEGARVVDDLAGVLGGVDVLVNNAGYGSSTPFLDLELEEWQGVIDVNLTGAFLAAQAAARRMVRQGRGGAIVNVTSVHEHIPLSGSGPYTASKHGLGAIIAAIAGARSGADRHADDRSRRPASRCRECATIARRRCARGRRADRMARIQ